MRMALLILAVGLAAVSAQAQQCLHGDNETAVEKERRILALNAVRFINTAEMNHFRQFGKYAAWKGLASSPATEEVRGWYKSEAIKAIDLSAESRILPGLTLRLTTNGEKYSLLLRDESDPCKFSFYTDQEGVIYYGQPIDMPPSAAPLSKPE
ncbi:MAG: hypothetical protein ACRD4T_05320 [Candidatus Acidiferrales bacterium]